MSLTASEKQRITDLWAENGHVYVTSQGYIHIHFYVSGKMDADFLVRKLRGRPRPHLKVTCVLITKRASLRHAIGVLLEAGLSDVQKQELSRVLAYAESKSKTERYGIARELRGRLFNEDTERMLTKEASQPFLTL